MLCQPGHPGPRQTRTSLRGPEKAARAISDLQRSTYEDRLRELGLLGLEDRRLQYDQVKVFKIIRGLDKVDWATWFVLVGHDPPRLKRDTSDPLNIISQASRTEITSHLFSQRVVAFWNEIPSEIKQLNSVAAFKNNIVKMLKLNMI